MSPAAAAKLYCASARPQGAHSSIATHAILENMCPSSSRQSHCTNVLAFTLAPKSLPRPARFAKVLPYCVS
eukprot:6201725-Pleurochrysis_carterae.AAC.2